jgi:glycosyltransferase involved in cell wall biosynthesis
MNENIFISILIPSNNNEKIIGKAIESCLNQVTSVNYEIIIVNNASTDNSNKAINRYKDSKIKLIVTDKKVTLYENHNECLNHASGEYILFCHTDDSLEPHAVEALYQKIKSRNFPKKYVLWGHSMFRDYQLSITNVGFKINEMFAGVNAFLPFVGSGLTPSGTCYSLESFAKLGGFLINNHVRSAGDSTSMIYLALVGFRFEMFDEMIFVRKDASVAKLDCRYDDWLNAIDDSYKYLFLNITDGQVLTLYNIGIMHYNHFLPFLYALSNNIKYKPKILRLCIKQIIKNPFYIRNKLVKFILKRCIK